MNNALCSAGLSRLDWGVVDPRLAQLERAFRAALERYERGDLCVAALEPRIEATLDLVRVTAEAISRGAIGATHARVRPAAGVCELLTEGGWRAAYSRSRSDLLELAWYYKARTGLPIGPLTELWSTHYVQRHSRWERFRLHIGEGDHPLVVLRHLGTCDDDGLPPHEAARERVAEAIWFGVLADKPAETTRCYEEALKRAEAAKSPRLQAWALGNLAGATEDHEEALVIYRRALALSDSDGTPLDVRTEATRIDLAMSIADCALALGNLGEAVSAYRRCIELLTASYGEDDLELVRLCEGLERCASARGRSDEAAHWSAKAAALSARFI